MKILFPTYAALLLSLCSAHADFMDESKSSGYRRKQPFVSQQIVKSPAGKTRQNSSRKMQAFQKPANRDDPSGASQKYFSWSGIFGRSDADNMRPGRENDNPAANRFGRASQPNSYIYGSHKRQ